MVTLAASPHAPVREAWLAQVSETILDPSLPIVHALPAVWSSPITPPPIPSRSPLPLAATCG